MFVYFLPLLFAVSFANIQAITIECSDGPAEFNFEDLRASRCLAITQNQLTGDIANAIALPGIDSKSLGLFLKLFKLSDDKIFALIDSLSPDEFKHLDYCAKYLRVYHELDALFKYKFLKEYSVDIADNQMREFVNTRFRPFKFVDDKDQGTPRWRYTTLYDEYLGPQFSQFQYALPEGWLSEDARAFFVLIDFYQEDMKKPLKLTTQHLKDVFYSFDPAVQNELLAQRLVIIP